MPSFCLISENKFGVSEFVCLVKKFSYKCVFEKICCLDNEKYYTPLGFHLLSLLPLLKKRNGEVLN